MQGESIPTTLLLVNSIWNWLGKWVCWSMSAFVCVCVWATSGHMWCFNLQMLRALKLTHSLRHTKRQLKHTYTQQHTHNYKSWPRKIWFITLVMAPTLFMFGSKPPYQLLFKRFHWCKGFYALKFSNEKWKLLPHFLSI